MLRQHRVETPPRVEYREPQDMYAVGVYEADGTRYEAVIFPVEDYSQQTMGTLDEGFIVVCGLTRRAYPMKRTGYLAPRYLMEKFDLNQCDAENFKTLLTHMMPERS